MGLSFELLEDRRLLTVLPFTIDPQQSRLTATGTFIGGTPLVPQGNAGAGGTTSIHGTLAVGNHIDSFTLATARCLVPKRCESFESDSDRYTGLLWQDEFPQITAHKFLQAVNTNDPQRVAELGKVLAHKIVIIGGQFHERSYGQDRQPC